MAMKRFIINIIAALIVVFVPTIVGAAKPFSTEQVGTISEEAFIYGFPIVLNYKVLYDSFIDTSGKSYKGPFNQIHSDAQVYTPKDTAVQTPNSDTAYSLLGADLRAEPLVVCIPKIERAVTTMCKWLTCTRSTTATLVRVPRATKLVVT
jgi:hypothetical protein